MDFRHRAWFGGLGLFCLSCVGCLQIPYLGPEVSVVRSIELGSAARDVHAFRVDTTCVDHVHCTGPCFGGIFRAEAHVVELAQIACTERGQSPAQANVSCLFGSYHLGVIPVHAFPIGTRHHVAVRLYRPGYETRAIAAGENPERVVWNPATDSTALEKAVDDLLGIASWAGLYSSLDAIPHVGHDIGFAGIPIVLEAGANRPAHRQALLFAAGEYEYLAMQPGSKFLEPEEAVRARLRDKARRLKSLADGNAEKQP